MTLLTLQFRNALTRLGIYSAVDTCRLTFWALFDATSAFLCYFDATSSRRVRTLCKSLTHSYLWRFGVKLRHSVRAVSGTRLSIHIVANLKRRYINDLNEWIQHGRTRHLFYDVLKSSFDLSGLPLHYISVYLTDISQMVILGDARTPWVYLLNEVAHPGRKNRPWPHPVRLQTLPPSSNKEINMRYWEPLNCSCHHPSSWWSTFQTVLSLDRLPPMSFPLDS